MKLPSMNHSSLQENKSNVRSVFQLQVEKTFSPGDVLLTESCHAVSWLWGPDLTIWNHNLPLFPHSPLYSVKFWKHFLAWGFFFTGFTIVFCTSIPQRCMFSTIVNMMAEHVLNNTCYIWQVSGYLRALERRKKSFYERNLVLWK